MTFLRFEYIVCHLQQKMGDLAYHIRSVDVDNHPSISSGSVYPHE